MHPIMHSHHIIIGRRKQSSLIPRPLPSFSSLALHLTVLQVGEGLGTRLETINIQSECIRASAMLHLPQEFNISFTNKLEIESGVR